MAKPHSSRPSKPHKDYPLGWHPSGYWCKRIRGKLHYFGKRNATAQEALDAYLEVKDALLAGRTPRVVGPDDVTVKRLCDTFMDDREHRLKAGEIVTASFNDYLDTAKRVADYFGRETLVADIGPDDFLKLRASFVEKWNVVTVANEVQRVRILFNFGWHAKLIKQPVQFGPSFRKPPRKKLREHRQSQELKLLSPVEIHAAIKLASPELRAMILLAINCGLGNRDIGKLREKHMRREWLVYPRPKTAVDRKAHLWEETREAVALVISRRRKLKEEFASQAPDLVFVTKYGHPWYAENGKADPISREIRKLFTAAGITRQGVTFYALRHTFRTVADGTKDTAAVEHVMGHEIDHMSATYREKIDDDRLVAVSQYVHQWLFAKEASDAN